MLKPQGQLREVVEPEKAWNAQHFYMNKKAIIHALDCKSLKREGNNQHLPAGVCWCKGWGGAL